MVAVVTIFNRTHKETTELAFRVDELRYIVQKWSGVLVILVVLTPPKKAFLGHGKAHSSLWLYPVNMLRNLCADLATTNWILPLDADFVPSLGLYAAMRHSLREVGLRNNVGIVVPHFEIREPDVNGTGPQWHGPPPANFEELAQALTSGKVRPFHSSNAEFGPLFSTLKLPGDGHTKHPKYGSATSVESVANRPADGGGWHAGLIHTNYSRWFYDSLGGKGGAYAVPQNATALDVTKKKPTGSRRYDTMSGRSGGPGWEPFLALKRYTNEGADSIPRYHEGFVGRYFNKVHFVTELRSQNMQFVVLRQQFLVHLPHKGGGKTGFIREMYQTMARMFFDDYWNRLVLIAMRKNAAASKSGAEEYGYLAWECNISEKSNAGHFLA
jgi:hypothetical protein